MPENPQLSENVIELQGVTKRYRSKVALSDVTLAIPAGVTGLLGPNGSGKSTMIKALLGLVRFQQGTTTVLGMSLPDQARSIRDLVGFMPEDDCYVAGLSGIETIQFMARLSGLPSGEGLRRAHEILDFADVGQERYRTVETYSTGMRQKLKFAQALVHDPPLLIFDEPTTGLDPNQRISMLRRIRMLATKHGKSILLSTHILHDVREVCKHVVILSGGRVQLVDTLERLSRPSRPGLRVRILGDVNRLIEELIRLNFETELVAHGAIWVHGIEESQSHTIWKAARTSGVSIVDLQPAIHSLEEIFLNAVRESQVAIA